MKQRNFAWQFAFGWMNFAFAVPSIYLMLGMPLIMRQHGWSGTEIGLFQLAALPTILKFLFALPVQKINLGNGHFVSWLWGLSVPLVALLIWLSTQNMINQPIQLFIFTFVMSMLLTWLDIPLNALAVQFFSRTQQIHAGSIRSAALFLGAIVGGGIMVLLHSHYGWQLPLVIIAIFILIGLIPFAYLRKHAQLSLITTDRSTTLYNVIQDWKEFFQQPYIKSWMALLILGFPFIGAVWLYLKPMLLDYGLSVQNVAFWVGIIGGIVGAVSSLIAGILAQHVGIAKTLNLYLSISILAILLLAFSLWLKLSPAWLIAWALCVGIGMGGVSALLFGLTFLFTRSTHNAIDYGLQTTLFTISRIGVPILAGMLLDYYGYFTMLCLLSFGIMIALVMSLKAQPAIEMKQNG
ncbi:MAG: MFS transporter [Acinetobacter sp.]